MKTVFVEDKKFDKGDFTENHLPKGEYENCIFNSCNFSNNDFSEFKFIDCEFHDCNLSLVKLDNTVFREVKFKGSKMLGLRFDTCIEFGLSFSFDSCQLNHSSFYKIKMKKTSFKKSQLQETDFTQCDLSNSTFDNCDFLNATFDNTNLEKVDFRTAYNYSIDPENNRIKKAKFSILGISGLLNKYEIEISN